MREGTHLGHVGPVPFRVGRALSLGPQRLSVCDRGTTCCRLALTEALGLGVAAIGKTEACGLLLIETFP